MTIEAGLSDTVETRLWLDEHAWLYALLKNPLDQAPSSEMVTQEIREGGRLVCRIGSSEM